MADSRGNPRAELGPNYRLSEPDPRLLDTTLSYGRGSALGATTPPRLVVSRPPSFTNRWLRGPAEPALALIRRTRWRGLTDFDQDPRNVVAPAALVRQLNEAVHDPLPTECNNLWDLVDL